VRLDTRLLSNDAGAKLLRAVGVKGDEAKLGSASDGFSGPLSGSYTSTLLGSYLTDAYNGEVGCRSDLSGRLARDGRATPYPTY
jgi:hypothetical protein